MSKFGWPWLPASLTGTIATPMPWVYTIRWFTQPVARGLSSRASSRPDSMTWRWTPSIE